MPLQASQDTVVFLFQELPQPLFLSRQQGSFFRLYYPCQEAQGAEKPDWIPSREYFYGLADFMKINRSLSEKIFNHLFGK